MSSTTSTPSDSPVAVQPLHNPDHAAHIVVPKAPLGNATNGPVNALPGMGVKALMAKKMAKNGNPKYISPTDNLVTPCSQKISAAKKKHWTKGTKPTGPLFASQPDQLIEEIDFEDMDSNDSSTDKKMTDDENPF